MQKKKGKKAFEWGASFKTFFSQIPPTIACTAVFCVSSETVEA